MGNAVSVDFVSWNVDCEVSGVTMAYLNVRERRLETTIAYVGPSLAGKNTNLQQLKSGGRATDVMETDGALLSLAWSPIHMPRFNDCDVMVKVVQARGDLSSQRLAQILADVDGVVVVVDAAPESRDENRRTMELVRASAAERPVVVQLNKSDLADAVGAEDLASIVEDWPVVAASAARGEGVVETLEMALESVIEAMKAKSTTAPDIRAAEPNPLLSALRQIMRETVTEHMDAVERAVAERVARAASAAVQDALVDVRASIASLQVDLLSVQSTMAASAKESARMMSSLVTNTGTSTLVERLDAIEVAAREGAVQVAEIQAHILDIATRGDVEAAETRVREEIVTRGRGEREHVTSAVSVLRRAIDAVATDVKKADRHGELVVAIEQIHAKADTLGEMLSPVATTTSTLSALPGRVAALETAVLRELRETVGPRLGRVDDVVQIMNVGTADAFERSEKRTTEIHAGLSELLDELKKRKKGWFS